MYKLLKAGFFRLKKDNIFLLFISFTILIAIFILFSNYISSTSIETLEISLDGLINKFIMFIGLFIAIFVSIFVGKEYSEGIIRNKVIVRA